VYFTGKCTLSSPRGTAWGNIQVDDPALPTAEMESLESRLAEEQRGCLHSQLGRACRESAVALPRARFVHKTDVFCKANFYWKRKTTKFWTH